MASQIIERMTGELFRRHVETIAKRAIDEGVRSGDDDSSLTKRVYKGLFSPNAGLVKAARAIPGFSYAPHLLAAALSEYFDSKSDSFLAGDNRPAVKVLRLSLKAAAPHVLAGIGEGASDAIEQSIEGGVDRVMSSNRVSETEKLKPLDYVVVVPEYFGAEPFYPIVFSADGHVELTPEGYPNVLSWKFIQFAARWVRENPKRTTKKSGGKGKQPITEEVPRVEPWIVVARENWAKMLGPTSEIGEEKLEEIKKLFGSPKGWYEKLSQETLAVFRAVIRSSRYYQSTGARNVLDRRDLEALVQSMIKAEPTPFVVDNLIGKHGFFDRIGKEGAPVGLLTLDALKEFEETVDIFLSGEQDRLTKIMRACRELYKSARSKNVSPVGVAMSIVAITSVIWFPIIVGSLIMLAAAFLFLDGLLHPLGGNGSGQAYAYFATFASGWIAYIVTLSFPVFQTATNWVRVLYPSLGEDWLVSIGRKIAGFGLVVCSTMIPVAILLGAGPVDRSLILLSAGACIGFNFMLVEAGYGYKARESVAKAVPVLAAVFGAGTLVWAYVHSMNPGIGADLVYSTDAAHSWVSGSKFGKSILLLASLFVLAIGVRWIEKARITGEVAIKERIPGSRLIMTAIAILGCIAIFFPDCGADKQVEDKEDATAQESVAPDGTADHSTPTRATSTPKSDPCSYASPYQRQQLGCK